MQIYHQKRQFDRTKKKEVVSLGENLSSPIEFVFNGERNINFVF
jgi:hypothetical protein